MAWTRQVECRKECGLQADNFIRRNHVVQDDHIDFSTLAAVHSSGKITSLKTAAPFKVEESSKSDAMLLSSIFLRDQVYHV